MKMMMTLRGDVCTGLQRIRILSPNILQYITVNAEFVHPTPTNRRYQALIMDVFNSRKLFRFVQKTRTSTDTYRPVSRLLVFTLIVFDQSKQSYHGLSQSWTSVLNTLCLLAFEVGFKRESQRTSVPRELSGMDIRANDSRTPPSSPRISFRLLHEFQQNKTYQHHFNIRIRTSISDNPNNLETHHQTHRT